MITNEVDKQISVDYCFKVFWTHNGMEMEADELHVVETVEEDNKLLTTLTIENVTPQDAGTYKVVAQNDAGEETVSASLIVQGTVTVKLLKIGTQKILL